MFFPVKGFAPDADPTDIGSLRDCDGLVPTLNGVASLPSDVDAGVASGASTVASIQTFLLIDGTIKIFAGTEGNEAGGAVSKLYLVTQSVWTDVSSSVATSYSATAEARWVFTQYQSASADTIYACQPGVQLQKRLASDEFSAVAGAPRALVCETVLDFVFCFNIDDTALGGVYGVSPNRWWCSAAGNPDSWTADIATQATTGLLTDTPGHITAGKRLGSNICAFKQTSMYIGRYVGAPTVWSWELVPGEGLGSWSHYNVVDIEGAGLMFIGYDNVYVFDGTRATAIGTNRVAQFIFDTMDLSKANRLIGFHHRQAWRVYWFMPTSATGKLDAYICYNYRSDRWTFGRKNIDFAFEYLEPGITYDELGSHYATYDDLPNTSYDTFAAAQGTFKPAIIGEASAGTAHTILKLEGLGGSSKLRTGYLGTDDTYTIVNRVRPRFRTFPTSGAQDHLTTSNLGEDVAVHLHNIALTNGAFDHVDAARWHQFEQSYTGSMELLGWDIQAAYDTEE